MVGFIPVKISFSETTTQNRCWTIDLRLERKYFAFRNNWLSLLAEVSNAQSSVGRKPKLTDENPRMAK